MGTKSLRILFIGNSHTYYNDMPAKVQKRFEDEGIRCDVAMLAHCNWSLAHHEYEHEAAFNILHGHYDYVVLQENSHPFAPEDKYFEALRKLNALIRQAGSRPVIYMTWSRKDEREKQEYMNDVHRRGAELIDALTAPVGENWWAFSDSRPGTELYNDDGSHASDAGSELAAEYIWNTIRRDMDGLEAGGK